MITARLLLRIYFYRSQHARHPRQHDSFQRRANNEVNKGTASKRAQLVKRARMQAGDTRCFGRRYRQCGDCSRRHEARRTLRKEARWLIPGVVVSILEACLELCIDQILLVVLQLAVLSEAMTVWSKLTDCRVSALSSTEYLVALASSLAHSRCRCH